MNCFLRESGVEPVAGRVDGDDPLRPQPAGPSSARWPTAHRSAITGSARASRSGRAKRSAAPNWPGWSATELAAATRHRRRPDAFGGLVEDSAGQERPFLERLPVTGTVDPWHAPNPFLAAEQAVRFGHPFHPAPKASGGFDGDGSRALRPRARRVVPAPLAGRRPGAASAEDRLGHRPVARPAAGAVRRRRRPARRPVRATWPLLPCHPWQAGVPRRPAGGGRADGRRPAGRPRAARVRRVTPPPPSARCGIRRPAGS